MTQIVTVNRPWFSNIAETQGCSTGLSLPITPALVGDFKREAWDDSIICPNRVRLCLFRRTRHSCTSHNNQHHGSTNHHCSGTHDFNNHYDCGPNDHGSTNHHCPGTHDFNNHCNCGSDDNCSSMYAKPVLLVRLNRCSD